MKKGQFKYTGSASNQNDWRPKNRDNFDGNTNHRNNVNNENNVNNVNNRNNRNNRNSMTNINDTDNGSRDKLEPGDENYAPYEGLIREIPNVRLKPDAFENAKQLVRMELIRKAHKQRKQSARRRYIWAPAAMAACLVIGIMVGKFFLSNSPATITDPKMEAQVYMAQVMNQYLEEMKPLLINYSNANWKHRDSGLFDLDKEKTEELAFRTRFLMKQPGFVSADKDTRQTMETLALLLTEIANMDYSNTDKLEIIKQTIKKQDLLFKIKFLSSKLANQERKNRKGKI